MKLACALTLDETSYADKILRRLKEQGYDAVSLTGNDTQGKPSRYLRDALVGNGLQRVLLLRQGVEDNSDPGSPTTPQVRANAVWSVYEQAGYKPEDILGVSIADEPAYNPGKHLVRLSEKQVASWLLTDQLSAGATAWRMILPGATIWHNSNTPSGRLYQRMGGPRSAVDFWRLMSGGWAMESWAGDVAGELLLAAYTSIWRTMGNRPRVFYGIGQKATSADTFDRLLRAAERSDVDLFLVWHFGPAVLQGNSVINADAYGHLDDKRAVVRDGVASWRAVRPVPQPGRIRITLRWPFDEDGEYPADEVRADKVHPFTADWDYAIDMFARAAVMELNGYAPVWAKEGAVGIEVDRSDPYPIASTGGWTLTNPGGPPGLLERRLGVAWDVALNNAKGATLAELRADAAVVRIEELILQDVSPPVPTAPEPVPVPPADDWQLRAEIAESKLAAIRQAGGW